MKATSLIALAIILLLLLGAIWFLIQLFRAPPPVYGLKKFSSCEELRNFVSKKVHEWFLSAETVKVFRAYSPAFLSILMEKGVEYSETNVQVPGVDEPDIVKTDGTYIYSVTPSGEGDIIFISRAFPPEDAKVVSNITLKGEEILGIFVRDEKLVVFSEYSHTGGPLLEEILPLPYVVEESRIRVYDISSRESPRLLSEISTLGKYKDSRMYGGFVYVVIQEPSYGSLIPEMKINGKEVPCACTDIYYLEHLAGNFYYFTTILSVNLDTQEVKRETFLLDDVATIYMSPHNLYLAYSTGLSIYEIAEKFIREVIEEVVPREIKDKIEEIMNVEEMSMNTKLVKVSIVLRQYTENLTEEEQENLLNKTKSRFEEWRNELKRYFGTTIFKFSIDEGEITPVANGSVPGLVLNQFSMDEFQGNFRIATTTRDPWGMGSEFENNVYVLDANLKLVGKLEGLEPNESIFAVRFVGEKGYVVTYRRIDPLLVIDLSDPSEPKLLGSLKIPGYSRYLHPYDEDHLVGVGMETDEEGREIGVKVSLFDVSDPTNPKEAAKYVVNASWSASESLWEHKAFLLDRAKQLLVIPIATTDYRKGESPHSFQGAYVFNVSTTSLELKGKITHMEETPWYLYYHYRIRRSLYIDDVLYTISAGKIKLNSLQTLDELGEIKFPVLEELRILRSTYPLLG